MTDSTHASDRSRLRALAFRARRERGLDPDCSADATAQAEQLSETPASGPVAPRDLRTLLDAVDRLRVRLDKVDVERGFIDFSR